MRVLGLSSILGIEPTSNSFRPQVGQVGSSGSTLSLVAIRADIDPRKPGFIPYDSGVSMGLATFAGASGRGLAGRRGASANLTLQ